MTATALITGAEGQDARLLARYLSDNGYTVIGLAKTVRSKCHNFHEIIEVDLCDKLMMHQILSQYKPREYYHLAAAHHSSEQKSTSQVRDEMLRVNVLSTELLIDAVLSIVENCRIFFASSSKMYTFGSGVTSITEDSILNPSNFYGLTKTASAMLVREAREKCGLWGVVGILFNHESPYRGEQYLTRKVSKFVGEEVLRLKKSRRHSKKKRLAIGDLNAQVDWSSASDFVRGFHSSLRANTPRDYVFSSGKLHTVKELIEVAFNVAGLDWTEYVVRFDGYIPNNTNGALVGDSGLAEEKLSWRREVTFEGLIGDMVRYDIDLCSQTIAL
jgi:GDPmannose 4,6-dehydratase